VLGADPHAQVLDEWGLTADADGLERFTDIVLAAAAGSVGLVNPQSAFYERHGWRGVRADVAATFAACPDRVMPSAARSLLAAGPDGGALRDAAARLNEEFRSLL